MQPPGDGRSPFTQSTPRFGRTTAALARAYPASFETNNRLDQRHVAGLWKGWK